jgi:hypothetical protein
MAKEDSVKSCYHNQQPEVAVKPNIIKRFNRVTQVFIKLFHGNHPSKNNGFKRSKPALLSSDSLLASKRSSP